MRYSRRLKQSRHVFWPNGIRDAEGNQGCRLCPLPKPNRIHLIDRPSIEAAHAERRRLAERDAPPPPPTLF